MTDPSPAPLPLMVHASGRRAVCVGGGAVAERKVEMLLDAGAVVAVVAPEAGPALAQQARQGRVEWAQRAYRAGDLRGALLAVAATPRADVNAAVASEAAERGILCVRADGGGTADMAAAVRRGPLAIAVSTGGGAPALAARLRAELESAYGPEYGLLAGLLGELRSDPQVRRALAELPAPERSARWRAILDTDILTLLRIGDATMAREVATACLFSSSD